MLLLRFPVNFILHPPYLMDFEVYRSVALRLAAGETPHLYDPTTSELMLFYAILTTSDAAPLGDTRHLPT